MPTTPSIDDLASPRFPLLSDTNYHDWAFNITAKLRSKGLWMLVNGRKQRPTVFADQEKWDLDQEMAAGLIASTLEPGQRVHVQGLEDDPVKMWEALRCVHVQQQANAGASTSPPEVAGSASTVASLSSHLSAHIVSNASYLWCTDSGASAHMTPHRHWFKELKPHKVPIELADNRVVYSEGIGSVIFHPKDKKLSPILLSDVLYVPQLRNNLLSVLFLTIHRGIKVEIIGTALRFYKMGKLILTATVNGRLAYLDGETLTQDEVNTAHIAASKTLDLELWHRRFGHLGIDAVKQLITQDMVDGLDITSDTPFPAICEACIHGKQHREPFPKKASTRASQILQLVHSDVHGPLKVATHQGFKYWITFIDDKSRFVSIYLIRTKDQAINAFRQYKALVENQTGKTIKTLRDDKGGEYTSKEFDLLTASSGIFRQRTAPATPQQNGVAERFNRTLEEGIIAMLHDAHLPPTFWGEAAMGFVQVHNCSPTSALPHHTPFQSWHGHKPSVSHFRAFGSTAYVHVPKAKRRHLESHTTKCVMIGYAAGTKAWRLWDPAARRVIISKDVIFDESPHQPLTHGTTAKQTPPQRLVEIADEIFVPQHAPVPPFVPVIHNDPPDVPASPPGSPPPPGSPSPPPSPPGSPSPPPSPPPHTPPQHPPRRSERVPIPPQPWWTVPNAAQYRNPPPVPRQRDLNQGVAADQNEGVEQADSAMSFAQHPLLELVNLSSAPDLPEPITYREAMSRVDTPWWMEACGEEYQSLMDNNVWTVVDLPPGKKAIGSKWVFKLKKLPDGSIDRFKARVVARGFTQKAGIDFTETFAPVVRFNTLRVLLAITAMEDLELDQVDFKSAYLNGEIEEEVYIELPDGYKQGNKVGKLNKAIYGTRQGGNRWHAKLDQAFHHMGFTRSKVDSCLYLYQQGSIKVYIPVYVDDQLMACNSRTHLDKIKAELSQHFKMKDMGPAKYIVGLEIHRDRAHRTLHLNQHKYALDVLKRFNMEDCKAVSTPLDPGCRLSKDLCPQSDEERLAMKDIPYLAAVGSLNYLAIGTRPDLAHAVGELGQFNSNPGLGHWKAVQHVLRYIKGTADLGLTYGPPPNPDDQCMLQAYCDANYAGDEDRRRSTTGYAFFIGGAAVSWSSKRQPTVATSSSDAEYMAANFAGREAMWLKQLLTELGYHIPKLTIHCDSQPAIAVSKNPEHHSRMKHIDVMYHWLREKVEKGLLKLQFVPTEEMVADVLTKGLARVKHEKCRTGLGMWRG
jgi:transposase InsO family protein